MKIRKLTADEVTFDVEVDFEHVPVEGNALASGDEDEDRACEQEIRRRMARNDIWAWCVVRVVARWEQFEGSDSLGCCSYESEEDFRASDYFADMKETALADLNQQIAYYADALEQLEQ